MLPGMFDQVVALGEGALAVAALVWLLARVDPVVTLQMVFACKPHITSIAGERPYRQMYEGVFLQRVLLGEGGAALRALERVRVRVRRQMGRHLPFSTECLGTLVTSKWFNAGVSHHMLPEIGVISKAFPTLRT